MNIEITKRDLEQVEEFAKNGELVDFMNDQGLSFGAMALVLDSIFKHCDAVKEKFENEEI